MLTHCLRYDFRLVGCDSRTETATLQVLSIEFVRLLGLDRSSGVLECMAFHTLVQTPSHGGKAQSEQIGHPPEPLQPIFLLFDIARKDPTEFCDKVLPPCTKF